MQLSPRGDTSGRASAASGRGRRRRPQAGRARRGPQSRAPPAPPQTERTPRPRRRPGRAHVRGRRGAERARAKATRLRTRPNHTKQRRGSARTRAPGRPPRPTFHRRVASPLHRSQPGARRAQRTRAASERARAPPPAASGRRPRRAPSAASALVAQTTSKQSHAHSFSSDFRRAAPFSSLMFSCAARSTISLRLRAETLCAISAAYLRFCIRSTSSSFTLATVNL